MGMTEVADLLKELEIIAHNQKDVDRCEPLITHFLEQSEIAITELESSY
jgi:hypothetical protein